MNYSDEIREELSEAEEPKYKLRFRTAERSTERKVSTAEVQFWPEFLREFQNSIIEKSTGSPQPEAIRVDLLTNSYYPDWIKNIK